MPLRIYKIELDLKVFKDQLEAEGYKSIPVTDRDFELYVKQRERSPSWIRFLQTITVKPLQILNQEASFVLLYFLEGDVYAAAGGQGHHVLEPAVAADFGLEVLSRLVTAPSVRLLRQLAPAGRVLQQETISRGSYSFQVDPGHQTRLVQHVVAQLAPAIIADEFGLEDNGRQTVRLEGRAAFSIRRGITLKEFKQVIKKTRDILRRQPTLELMMSCRTVPRTRWGELNQSLFDQLAAIYDKFLSQGSEVVLDAGWISLSHDDARHLMQCSSFSVSSRTRSAQVNELDLVSVFSLLREWGRDRLPSLGDVHIEGLDDDGNRMFRETLNKLIVAELRSGNETYFRVSSRWFKAREGFVSELDNRLARFIHDEVPWGVGLPDWALTLNDKDEVVTVSEDSYLFDEIPRHYPGSLILHKDFVPITSGNDKAEICDLLDFSSNRPTMVFIKRGVNEGARELARQAVDSIDLMLGEARFREQAQSKIFRGVSNSTNPVFDPRDANVLLAMTDKSRKRRDESLLSKLTSLSKMELVGALELLERYGIPGIGLYEVPHELDNVYGHGTGQSA